MPTSTVHGNYLRTCSMGCMANAVKSSAQERNFDLVIVFEVLIQPRCIVLRDVFLGKVLSSERSREVTFHARPRGLFTVGHGGYDWKIFGADDSATTALRGGNDSGDGSRFRSF